MKYNSYCVITFAANVRTILSEQFAEQEDLRSIRLPYSVTSIGEDAFDECYNLRSVSIPNSVKIIGDEAFNRCDLQSVTIPESVREIGEEAFCHNSNLRSVYCKSKTPPVLYSDLYYDSACFYDAHESLVIYVPTESVQAYKNAKEWSVYEIKGYDFSAE